MSKAVIIYYSEHRNNTKKVLEAIKEQCQVGLVPIQEVDTINLADYERIGFASGIYHAKFAPGLYKYIESHKDELKGKETFLVATGGGGNNQKVFDAFGELLKEAQATVLGSYYCNGWDCYGPFKLMGGIHKKHPDEKDCKEAVSFYKGL